MQAQVSFHFCLFCKVFTIFLYYNLTYLALLAALFSTHIIPFSLSQHTFLLCWSHRYSFRLLLVCPCHSVLPATIPNWFKVCLGSFLTTPVLFNHTDLSFYLHTPLSVHSPHVIETPIPLPILYLSALPLSQPSYTNYILPLPALCSRSTSFLTSIFRFYAISFFSMAMMDEYSGVTTKSHMPHLKILRVSQKAYNSAACAQRFPTAGLWWYIKTCAGWQKRDPPFSNPAFRYSENNECQLSLEASLLHTKGLSAVQWIG